MATPAQEAIWVVQAQCDDREALELLLRSVQPALHRYVGRLVGVDLVDDVVQEVLITVARKLKWLSEPRLFRAWTFRIASRHAFRHLQKERRYRYDDSDLALESVTSAESPPTAESVRDILESEVLSPASRAVMLLHFQEGMTLPEVAAVLEIPLGTAKSRLAYGLTVLRRHFGVKKESLNG